MEIAERTMCSQESSMAPADKELLPLAFSRYADFDEMSDGGNTILHIKRPAISQQRANEAFSEPNRSSVVR
jgi:hypothetical protein